MQIFITTFRHQPRLLLYRQSYNTIPFPVFVTIIPQNTFNLEKLKLLGYNRSDRYFMGTGLGEGFNWSAVNNNVNGK